MPKKRGRTSGRAPPLAVDLASPCLGAADDALAVGSSASAPLAQASSPSASSRAHTTAAAVAAANPGRSGPPTQELAASASAEVFEDASADEFQDALEELLQDDSDCQGDVEEDPIAKLVGKDSSLQQPIPARADWGSELQALQQLVSDSSVSDDEKIKLVHEALTQRVEDLRNLEEHRTATERSLEELARESGRCKKETQVALAAKAKLEDSCRELRQLKTSIAAESQKIIEDEQERQRELNSKFQTAMKDVEEKMNAESEVREHFVKENEELRTKLEKFTETYGEQERQLAEQNVVRAQEMGAARERLKEYATKSVESAANAKELEKQNKALQKTTVALRAELQSILGKFDEFHECVNGSNKRHGEYKEEIDGLSVQLKELEAENADLKGNKRIDDATKEKEAAQKQRDALDRLCMNLAKEIKTMREHVGKKGGC